MYNLYTCESHYDWFSHISKLYVQFVLVWITSRLIFTHVHPVCTMCTCRSFITLDFHIFTVRTICTFCTWLNHRIKNVNMFPHRKVSSWEIYYNKKPDKQFVYENYFHQFAMSEASWGGISLSNNNGRGTWGPSPYP